MIDNKEYKPRIIDKEVERYLSVFGAEKHGLQCIMPIAMCC